MYNPFFSLVIPGAVLVFSFVVTYLLYRHFSKKENQ